ncbi:hypothetical protein HDU78_000301 [Chytriomyces hyalinus]|nr:hypothetical protein HDU78_000301 [Chytriomyces hyalinus]
MDPHTHNAFADEFGEDTLARPVPLPLPLPPLQSVSPTPPLTVPQLLPQHTAALSPRLRPSLQFHHSVMLADPDDSREEDHVDQALYVKTIVPVVQLATESHSTDKDHDVDPVQLMLGTIAPRTPSPDGSDASSKPPSKAYFRASQRISVSLPFANYESAAPNSRPSSSFYGVIPNKRNSVASFQESIYSSPAQSPRFARRSFATPTNLHTVSNASGLHVPSRPPSMSVMQVIHQKMSTSSMHIGEAVISIRDGVGERLGAGYSNDWTFGIFDKWWSVEEREVRFMERGTTKQPTGQPEMVIQQSPSQLFGAAGSTTLSYSQHHNSNPHKTSTSYPSHDSILHSPNSSGSGTGSPPRLPRGPRLPHTQSHSSRGTGSSKGSDSGPAAVKTQPVESPMITVSMHVDKGVKDNTNKPAGPSCMPFLKALCCPCLMFGENRELFVRNGGVIEEDAVSMCCGDSVHSSEFSRIMKSALCFTSAMPLCMCCIPHRALRKSIKQRYALHTHGEDETQGQCGECMISVFCLPCALLQERREIVHWEGVVGDARKRRSTAFI